MWIQGKSSWLNFGLDDQQKIELFFRVLWPLPFFWRAQNPTIKKLKSYVISEKDPFCESQGQYFSMYQSESECFECAELDPLLGDVRFDWQAYKVTASVRCWLVPFKTKPEKTGIIKLFLMCLCDVPYTFYFYVSSPCHLLIWLIWLFVAGCLVTGRILTISNRFYFYATIDKTTQKETIHPISVIRDLQLWKNYARFSEMIENLSVKMKATIRMGLYLDFLFMFFSYGALYLLARWIAHCYPQTSSWPEIWFIR